jgi:cell division protein ZapA (FtsZ GTPase activity inhibitor)
MKKYFLLLGLLCSSSLFAQFTYNDGGSGGIQSPGTSATGINSFSTGYLTSATGDYGATALGSSSEASGIASIAIGDQVTASGDYGATALGFQTTASGEKSIAMGDNTQASGYGSTAMGEGTIASGPNSTAMGVITIANGPSATSFGESTTASGLVSTAMGWGTNASGDRSTAMGRASVASGDFSTAMGNQTEASGSSSIAGGEKSIASGWASMAFGYESTADATVSYAIGDRVKADALGTFAIGYNSTGVENAIKEVFSYSNRAFVIGNGGVEGDLGYSDPSDAVTILFDGTTTIAGNVTAASFIGDGSQLTNTPLSFNENGSGIQSPSNTASGAYAVAIGNQFDSAVTTPTYLNEATGNYSFVIGNNNLSTGIKAFSIGTDNFASAKGAMAIGENNIASGSYSQAFGVFSEASANFAFGIGNNTLADGYNTTAIGSANTADPNADATTWSTDNRAFVIGNGYYDGELGEVVRSDAFTVLFNGDATLAGNLNINSDARLKSNIISLGSTLAKVLAIDGKSYTMNRDKNKKTNIGVLAQDVQKVFPELVSESNDILSVNYQGLIPVLINAIKEQQQELNKLKAVESELALYKKKFLELESRISKIEKY